MLKSPLVFWPGASWLGKRCTTNSTCISSNSQCFKGKCLCSPGYYYSEEDRTCIGGKCTAQTQHAAHLLVVSLLFALAPCYSEYGEMTGSSLRHEVTSDWCQVEVFDPKKIIIPVRRLSHFDLLVHTSVTTLARSRWRV